MKKRDVVIFVKECMEILHHAPFCMYWSLYDYAYTAYTRLFKKKYVGIYVKIMSPSEQNFFFSWNNDNVGGGYSGHTIVKIFLKKRWFSTETTIELIKHEVLHQVLRKNISYEACGMLDNVHMCFAGVVRGKKTKVIYIDFII